MQQHDLHQWSGFQLEVKKTIIDVFLTNAPLIWKAGKTHKGLVRSDHLVITVSPLIPAKPQRKYVSFRDTRDHHKINMESKLKAFDWRSEESVQLLN